jgi:hypothetical protein
VDTRKIANALGVEIQLLPFTFKKHPDDPRPDPPKCSCFVGRVQEIKL